MTDSMVGMLISFKSHLMLSAYAYLVHDVRREVVILTQNVGAHKCKNGHDAVQRGFRSDLRKS